MEEQNNEKTSISFDVTMDAGILYDYMITHAYSGTTGILGTCFGALGILLFIGSGCTAFLYLILGVVIILYLPVSLRMRASQLMTLGDTYKKPLHYVLDENGITVSQGDVTQTVGWDKCVKAVSTKKSIAVYTGKNNASVFPRKQLGDQLPAMLAVLSEYMDPKKVKIRY